MASSVSSVESSAISSFFFFQAEDGIRDLYVTGVQTCALPIFPVYTVLVPVFREARVVGRLVANLGRLDYPADKLEVRSEERRVGKECRSRGSAEDSKKEQHRRAWCGPGFCGGTGWIGCCARGQ